MVLLKKGIKNVKDVFDSLFIMMLFLLHKFYIALDDRISENEELERA
jgi:hypothetical protein